ncbi:hypothetical protein [Pseudomonas aeruginosa]
MDVVAPALVVITLLDRVNVADEMIEDRVPSVLVDQIFQVIEYVLGT